jgi:hypothetical protein
MYRRITDGRQSSDGRTWYHVAAVNDNGTRHLYLDGVEQTLSGTAMTVANSSNPLCIGRDFQQPYFDGSIDEVRI